MPVQSSGREGLRRGRRDCRAGGGDERRHRCAVGQRRADAGHSAQNMECDERKEKGRRIGRGEGDRIMKEFNYHRPTKPADAVKFIKKARNGKLMSGGMTLIPTMKQGLANPSDIVDLGGLKNSGVAVSGSKVTVKAGTTHAEVTANEALKKTLPALATLAAAIGDPLVRNRG